MRMVGPPGVTVKVQLGSPGSPGSCPPSPSRSLNFVTQISAFPDGTPFLLPKLRLTSWLGETVTVWVPVGGAVGVHPACNTSEIVYVAGAGTPKQKVP